jgi:hypothetical protein
MHAAQTLATVNITAARTSAYLAKVGFIERQHQGFGSFLTPEHIDSMASSIMTPAQFMRDVPGVELRCKSTCVAHRTVAPDCFFLYIDGVSYRTDQLDQHGLTPDAIAAMEVYDHPSMIPVEFQGGVRTCGAIVVWTKARVS